MRYFDLPTFWPGWRNWQTQRTQNPPTLAVMGVRPPLPAPALSVFRINWLTNFEIVCAQIVPKSCPDFTQLPLFGTVRMREHLPPEVPLRLRAKAHPSRTHGLRALQVELRSAGTPTPM
jgi:hypothetical protein